MKSTRGFIGRIFRRHEDRILGLLALVAFGAGSIGFHGLKAEYTWSECFYRSLGLFLLQTGTFDAITAPPILDFARWLAAVVAGIAFIKAVTIVLSQDFTGVLFNLWGKNHLIVAGLGDNSKTLVEDAIDIGEQVVILDTEEHLRLGESDILKKSIVVRGRITDEDALQRGKLEQAKHCVIFSENDKENIQSALALKELLAVAARRRKKPLTCLVHVFDHQLRFLYSHHSLFQKTEPFIEARLFNLFDLGAGVMFDRFCPDRTSDVHLKESPAASILLIGFGWMGQSLALQVAQLGHFASGKKCRLTVIDHNLLASRPGFESRFPGFGEVIDVDWRSMKFESLTESELVMETNHTCNYKYNVIYICLGDDLQTIHAGMRVRQLLRGSQTRVVLAFVKANTLSGWMNEERFFADQKLEIFDLQKEVGKRAVIIDEHLDRDAREYHRRYCEDMNRQDEQKGSLETAGKDPSRVDWPALNQEFRESNRRRALHLKIKLRSLGLIARDSDIPMHIENRMLSGDEIDTLAGMEHDRWKAERLLDGWQPTESISDPKDSESRRNPFLRHWCELVAEERKPDCPEALKASLVANRQYNCQAVRTEIESWLKAHSQAIIH